MTPRSARDEAAASGLDELYGQGTRSWVPATA